MKSVLLKIVAVSVLFALSFSVYAKAAEKAEKPEKPKKEKKVKVVAAVEDEGAFQAKNIDVRVGKVRYRLRGAGGNCQMSVYNSGDVPVSLFAVTDEFSTSFYDLKIGKRIYRLNETVGVVTGCRKNERGGQMVYILPNKVRLFVKYEKVDVPESIESEVIKVTAVVMNKGKKTDSFALKTVLDTVLGEKTGPHFSTSQEKEINTERQFRELKDVKWVMSGDSKVSLQFILSGADVTEPEVVTACNKDFAMLSNWVPVINSERNFDSVISYNNSALSFVWHDVMLAPGEQHAFSYYMVISTDSKPAQGEAFVEWYEKKLENAPEEKKYSVKEFEDLYNQAFEKYTEGEYEEAYKIIMKLWENPENRNERSRELKEAIEAELGKDKTEEPAVQDEPYDYEEDLPPDTDNEENPEETPEVKFDLNSITAEKLNPSYVQGLLERINSLESGAENLDRAEILRLHAELDAIMEKLRQR